jgi:hypothetical protein
MMSKIIKKIVKVFAYLLLVLFLIPVILSGVIQLPKIQDFAVSKTLSWIGEELGTKLSYSSVRITTMTRIRLCDLYIEDQSGDTLIYAAKAKAVMPVIFSFFFSQEPVMRPLKKIELEKPVVNFSIDSTNNINFKFILDHLQSGEKKNKKSEVIKIDRIKMTDGRFTLSIYDSPIDSTGIDFGNLALNHLDCDVSDLTIKGDTIALHIQPLSFTEQSGFQLTCTFLIWK